MPASRRGCMFPATASARHRPGARPAIRRCPSASSICGAMAAAEPRRVPFQRRLRRRVAPTGSRSAFERPNSQCRYTWRTGSFRVPFTIARSGRTSRSGPLGWVVRRDGGEGGCKNAWRSGSSAKYRKPLRRSALWASSSEGQVISSKTAAGVADGADPSAIVSRGLDQGPVLLQHLDARRELDDVSLIGHLHRRHLGPDPVRSRHLFSDAARSTLGN